jgi:hypothetical protein
MQLLGFVIRRTYCGTAYHFLSESLPRYAANNDASSDPPSPLEFL